MFPVHGRATSGEECGVVVEGLESLADAAVQAGADAGDVYAVLDGAFEGRDAGWSLCSGTAAAFNSGVSECPGQAGEVDGVLAQEVDDEFGAAVFIDWDSEPLLGCGRVERDIRDAGCVIERAAEACMEHVDDAEPAGFVGGVRSGAPEEAAGVLDPFLGGAGDEREVGGGHP